MVRIDWESYDEPAFGDGPLGPGVYRVEVAECVERTSRVGDKYFNVKFKDLDTGKIVCFDPVMLEGKGASIGLCKLSRLGFEATDSEIIAAQVIGRRAYIGVDNDTYEGKSRLKVDIGYKGSSCGYWEHDNMPSDYVSPDEPEVNNDPPF